MRLEEETVGCGGVQPREEYPTSPLGPNRYYTPMHRPTPSRV